MGSTIYKILQYTAQILAIFLIFKFLPELTNGNVGAKLTNVDVLIITAIIMLIYILFENLCNIYSYGNNTNDTNTNNNMSQSEKISMCSSVCSMGEENKKSENEHMTNVSTTPNNNGLSSTEIINTQRSNTNSVNTQRSNTNSVNTQRSTIDFTGDINTNQDNQSYRTSPYFNPYLNNQNKKIEQANSIIQSDNTKRNDEFGTIRENRFNPSLDNRDDRKMYVAETDLVRKYEELNKLRDEYERKLEKKYENEYNKYYKETGKALDADKAQIERDGSRYVEGVVINDTEYDTDYNHLPMATGDDSRDYEYGYSYLPPRDWAPKGQLFPPLCINSDRPNQVYPYIDAKYTDLLEWNDSIRITPPDNINTNYIKKVNAGR
jgi:hypothetical protein